MSSIQSLTDIRVQAKVTVDSVDAQGFEGGLEARYMVEKVREFDEELAPNLDAPVILPAASGILTPKVLAMTFDREVKIFLGSTVDGGNLPVDPLTLEAGSFIIIGGIKAASVAGGIKVENENADTPPESVRLEGIVGGSAT